MKPLFVGIGNAGSAILNALLEYKEVKKVKPIVILPKSKGGEEDTVAATRTAAKSVEFAFLFAGFSDSDITASVVELLDEQNIKTLFFGILPANRREEREEILSAYQSLENLKEYTNPFIIVDNQKIAHHPNYKEFYPRYNQYIASCIADILAGIHVKNSPAASELRSTLHIDEVVKALSLDDGPGYVAVSRASELTKGLSGYVFPFMRHKPLDLMTLLRVSLEKFSVADAPIGCEKSVSFLRVPDYYVRSGSVDKKLIEDFMLTYSKESHLAVSTTKRNMAAVTTLFTYKFEQLGRLRDIRGFADEEA